MSVPKKKFVYVVEDGSLNSVNKTFEFNEMEVFTSHKKALEYINYNYTNYSGFDIDIEQYVSFNTVIYLYTYKVKTYINTEILRRFKLSVKMLK